MSSSEKIIIIGAGPGGLTAGMLLANKGYKVTIYEKDSRVGGRNQAIEEKGFKFDTGPTFLMMKFILDEMFKEAGLDINDYLEFTNLEPMYRLQFKDLKFDVSSNKEKMKQEMQNVFGESEVFDKFLKKEKERFDHLFPCLQKSYSSLWHMFNTDLFKALPFFSLNNSMFDELGKYFKNEKMKLSFTFQSKYLGMSPWECPAAFMIIPYIEHAFGIYHVKGGLSEISEAMAKACQEKGVEIKLNTPVKNMIIENKTVKGVELESGEKDMADKVIINADFAYSMNNLAAGKTKKYTPEKLKNKKYSCSIFMLYLGLDKQYDLPHHTIFFSDDYKKYTRNIFKDFELNEDISFYIRNASVNDETLAPEGKSAVYVLVPVANNNSKIDWSSKKQEFRNVVIRAMQEKAGMKDLSDHIEYEKITTPQDWEDNYNVYLGATFNLAHNIGQMLAFRPRNKFEEFKNCYLVGGGTHPGSGLPTIYESARITTNLITGNK